jgi:hypothetical protein
MTFGVVKVKASLTAVCRSVAKRRSLSENMPLSFAKGVKYSSLLL